MGRSRKKRSESYNLRRVACEGCARRCRYKYYRTAEFRKLQRGHLFKEAVNLLKENQEDQGRWRHKHRHGTLGFMHQIKWESWERETKACQEHMEDEGLELGLGVHPPYLDCRKCCSPKIIFGPGRLRTCAHCGYTWVARRKPKEAKDA